MFALPTSWGFFSHLAQEAAESSFSRGHCKRSALISRFDNAQVCTVCLHPRPPVTSRPTAMAARYSSRDAERVARSCLHVHSRSVNTAPYLPQAQQQSAGPTAPPPPLSSFRHGACYRVIALLINVSPSRDNSVIFAVRFFRLAMRDVQWCNLLSVYYALLGAPVGTV